MRRPAVVEGGPVPSPTAARAVTDTSAVVPAPRVPVDTDAVEDQLARLEARLVAEVAGDALAVLAVREHVALARARFASATVTRYLPILVEREVRRRLRADAGAR